MNSNQRRTTTPEARSSDDRPARERAEEERRRERERERLGAAQLAAPSTRRWRRPERPQRSG